MAREKAQKGECLLYSPQWLGGNRKFKFPLRECFHAGYTPEIGKVIVEPTDLKIQELVLPIVTSSTTIEKEEEEEVDNVKKQIGDTKILMYALIFGVALYIVSVIV